MYLYVDKISNVIFHFSEEELLLREDCILTETGQIAKNRNEYEVFTVQHTELYDFHSSKYVFQDGKVLYRIESEQLEDKWKKIREERNLRLSESDTESMILFSDYWANQSEEYKTTWVNYRQALRDVTLQEDPYNIDWPIHPDPERDVELQVRVGIPRI